MEMLQAHSHNSTKLNNRILWFDGDSTINANDVIYNITNDNIVDSLFVDTLTDEIAQYNTLVSISEKISIKTTINELSFEWNIPIEYKKLNVVKYVSDMLMKQDGLLKDIESRQRRCADELALYKKLGLFDTVRALIYIINILVEKNIVWGVGRGSSVSSYVLYIIGVHDVDSYYYGLDIEDFLRT